MTGTGERPILFFDGVCNLCNRAVLFVIRHDRQQRFLFAALQSPRGVEVRRQLAAERGAVPDSLVLAYKGKLHTESAAALRTCLLLGGGWSLLAVGLLLPRFLRDGLYRFIARRRYRWWGRQESCMVPTPELRARFLEP